MPTFPVESAELLIIAHDFPQFANSRRIFYKEAEFSGKRCAAALSQLSIAGGARQMKHKETGLTLASSVYESIRHDIMNGGIRPGDKLLFDALREKYSIGISPLREALNRLHSDGWVAREEQKGFRAAEISADELRKIVRTRILIEGTAITEAIRLQDVESEEALVLAYHRLKKQKRHVGGERSPAWEKSHRDFHMALVAGAKLPHVTTFCMQLFDIAERYRILCASSYPERNERDEHDHIVSAYLEGDAEKTIALLAAHYQVTVDIILKVSFT
jgi:GntR family transcriptional regulator, carbon starvation induced regulator